MSKKGNFLGRINLALASVKGEQSIFIDALEFNPQAVNGKPLYKDATECFHKALEFCKELAQKMNCKFYGLKRSNSSGANAILDEQDLNEKVYSEGPPSPDESDELIPIKVTLFDKEMRDVLKAGGHTGGFQLFYQALDNTIDPTKGPKAGPEDKNLATLENEVLNPAQITDEIFAAFMRGRDFKNAAQRLLENEEWLAKVQEIYKIPKTLKLSPQFLVLRMEKIYSGEAQTEEKLSKAVFIKKAQWARLS